MYQRRISQLYSQILVPLQSRSDTKEIRLVQESQWKGLGIERGEQDSERLRVGPQ